MLIDDAVARRIARSRGLNVSGTLGVLAAAERAGLLSDIQTLPERLRAAGFFVSDEALKVAGLLPADSLQPSITIVSVHRRLDAVGDRALDRVHRALDSRVEQLLLLGRWVAEHPRGDVLRLPRVGSPRTTGRPIPMRTRGKSSVRVFAMMSATPFWPPPAPRRRRRILPVGRSRWSHTTSISRAWSSLSFETSAITALPPSLLYVRVFAMAIARPADLRLGERVRARLRLELGVMLLRQPARRPEPDVPPVARVLRARVAEREHESDVVLAVLVRRMLAEDAAEDARHASSAGGAARRRIG